MDIFFKNDGSYSQSTVGIPVLVDYTPVGFVREVNADMVTCSLFDKFIGKEWLAQRLTTKEPDICSVYIDTKCWGYNMGVSISEFRGEYYFLSNFYSAPVTYNGMCFENNEAAFQAAKCPERMTEFCRLNPSEAKRLGRRVKLRGDWEAVKDTVMYEICKAKFSQNPDLADKLVATKDAELIEGNTWGDRIWGVCDGVGENRLGKILMRVRAEM